MKIKEIMSKNLAVIMSTATIQDAAKIMKEKDYGFLPVNQDNKTIGVITDRDLIIRALAEGLSLSSPVQSILRKKVIFCFEDDDVGTAAKLMEKEQVRRLIVFNKNKQLIGIVTLGDIANKTGNGQLSGEILECISKAA